MMTRKLLAIIGFLLGLYFVWIGISVNLLKPDGDGIGLVVLGTFEYLVKNEYIFVTSIIFIIIGLLFSFVSTFLGLKKINTDKTL
jgi:hypothetical protein